jgi:hypothetical protein
MEDDGCYSSGEFGFGQQVVGGALRGAKTTRTDGRSCFFLKLKVSVRKTRGTQIVVDPEASSHWAWFRILIWEKAEDECGWDSYGSELLLLCLNG